MKVAFSVLILVASSIADDTCGRYWKRKGNKCYLFVNVKASWIEALNFCNTIGARLAVPENDNEQEDLKEITIDHGKDDVWIGIGDFIKEGTWISFPNIRDVGNKYWGNHEPNGKVGEGCVQLIKLKEYKWNDRSCEDRLYFICEKKK